MNDENALKCYECAVKADGQLDLILSMLAKLHALRSHENFMEKEIHSARQVVIIAMSKALNESKLALNHTKDERFGNIAIGLGNAISLVERDELYKAGDILIKLASDHTSISNHAISKFFKKTQYIW